MDEGACGTQAAGMVDAGENVGTLQAWMRFKDIIHRVSCPEVTQNGFYRNPGSADYRTTIANFGI